MKKIIVLALFSLSLLFTISVNAAPAFDKVSLSKYNRELQALFDKVSGSMQQSITSSVDSTLRSWPSRTYGISPNERITTSLVSWGSPQTSGLGTAPGFILRADGGFSLRVPSSGSWGMSVPNMVIRLRVEHCIRYFLTKCYWQNVGESYVIVSLNISNMTVQTGMRINVADTGKVNFDNIEEPVISYSATLSGPSFPGSDTLLALFNPVSSTFGIKIKGIVFSPNGTISSIVPNKVIEGLGILATRDLTPVGSPFRYTFDPFAGDIGPLISNIDDKIINVNMPHGIVYEVYSDTPVNDSWYQAFPPGSNTGSPGTHTRSLTTGDSAIWTGHYLAALAYRYKVKRDSQSLAYVDKALKGIEVLYAANGNSGLLARGAAPLDSVVGQQINADPPNDQGYGHLERGTQRKIFLLKNDQGVDVEWISHQGTNGISRDQYTGVMLGLRTAYDFVDDQNIKDRIKYLTTITLNYLIKENWIITEDRNLTAGGTPTAWVTVPYHKITMLTIGNYITGGLYQQELNDAYGLMNIAWFSSAISILDPLGGYYKYNLFYASMLSYFAIEKDPVRREKMMEGVRIIDYYTGHHNNAWFNLIRASYDPSNKEELLEQANVTLRYRMHGGHRHLPPDSIQQICANNVAYENVQFPLESTPRAIPKGPLYPPCRVNGEFVWQRNPYELVTYDSNSATIESIGGDLSLVYWMLEDEGYANGFAEMIAPTENSTLTTSSVKFQWTAPSRHVTGTALYVGTQPGAADIFGAQTYTNEQVVTNIPLTGAPIYVQLWSWNNTRSFSIIYVYNTESPAAPEIISPVPGSTLTSSAVTFQWAGNADIYATALYVGNTPVGADIYGELTNGATQQTIQNIPLTGEPVYVRLWSSVAGVHRDYVYQTQALIQRPATSEMVYPIPGSTVLSSDVIFSWIKGQDVTYHWLSMGTLGVGSSNFYNASVGVLAYETISNIPLGSGTLYVRLWSMKSGIWYYNDYSYPLQ